MSSWKLPEIFFFPNSKSILLIKTEASQPQEFFLKKKKHKFVINNLNLYISSFLSDTFKKTNMYVEVDPNK